MKWNVTGSIIIVVVILLASLTTVGILWRTQPSSPSRSVAPCTNGAPETKWWQTRFEPGRLDGDEEMSWVEFRRENIIPDLHCGSLDGAKLDEDRSIFLWGWAFDPEKDLMAQGLHILEGKKQLQVSVRMGLERPDVAEFLNNPALGGTGWNARISRDSAPPGEHVYRAYAILDEGRLCELTSVASISVRAANNP